MLRSVVVVLIVGVVRTTHAGHGKVVRVEAHGTHHASVPRICELSPVDGTGHCFGEVVAGDVAVLLDTNSMVGEMRIVESHVEKPNCRKLQTVTATLIRGSLPRSVVGIVGGSLDARRGHLLANTSTTPSPNGHDPVLAAIDRDGDGIADIVITQTECETATGTGRCIEMWASDDKPMHVVHQFDESCA